MEEFTRLQVMVEKGGRNRDLAEHTLNQLVEKASRQPELMQALKQQHVAIAKEFDMLHKNIVRQRELGRGLER